MPNRSDILEIVEFFQGQGDRRKDRAMRREAMELIGQQGEGFYEPGRLNSILAAAPGNPYVASYLSQHRDILEKDQRGQVMMDGSQVQDRSAKINSAVQALADPMTGELPPAIRDWATQLLGAPQSGNGGQPPGAPIDYNALTQEDDKGVFESVSDSSFGQGLGNVVASTLNMDQPSRDQQLRESSLEQRLQRQSQPTSASLTAEMQQVQDQGGQSQPLQVPEVQGQGGFLDSLLAAPQPAAPQQQPVDTSLMEMLMQGGYASPNAGMMDPSQSRRPAQDFFAPNAGLMNPSQRKTQSYLAPNAGLMNPNQRRTR